MQIVITGGAGFIGANLARKLTSSPWVDDVVVVDDLSSGRVENLAELPVQFHEGSVLDAAFMTDALADADAVVHLAAVPSVPRSLVDPLRSHHANATGTLQVLEAARLTNRPQVIVASSSSVYGANRTLPKHEDLRPEPMSPYAVSKLATETYALAYASCFGLDVLPFRFFNVFGPLQPPGHAYAAVVPAFVDAALSGRPLVLYGDGTQTRDFTYVGTVVDVLADAVRRRVTSDIPVNLAYGTRTSLLELVSRLEGLLERPLEIEKQPPRPGDVPHSQADPGRLLALFGDVLPTRLVEGLEATVRWMLASCSAQPA